MPIPPGPTRAECDSTMTAQYLFVSRLLHAAIMGGPVVYAVAIFALFATVGGAAAPPSQAMETMDTLSMVHVGFTITAFLLAPFLFNRVLNRTRLDPGQDANTPQEQAAQALLLLRTAMLVRMAVLEGAAFFGLSVCLVGVTGGVLQAEPLHWLNLGSSVLLIAYGAVTFPTREGLLDILESHFGA